MTWQDDLVLKCQSFSAVVSGFPSTGVLVSSSLASSLLNSVLFISSTSSSTCMDKDMSSYGNMTTRQRAASKKKTKKAFLPMWFCLILCVYFFIDIIRLSIYLFACCCCWWREVGNGVRVYCAKSPDLTNDNCGEENSVDSTRDEKVDLGTLPPVSSPVKTNSVSKALSMHQKRSWASCQIAKARRKIWCSN